MKNITLIFLGMIITGTAFSQSVNRPYLTNEPTAAKGGIVGPITNPTVYIGQHMFGPCVEITNLSVNYGGKSLYQIGSWSDSLNTVGIDTGIIISTGYATGVINAGSVFASTDMSGPGDTTLTNLCGSTTYDAVSIEFDFIPLADSILAFEFVFGSEEYPEYVGSSYNDIFGFFISGPGYTGQQNIALVPGTTVPIAINNVNPANYSQYYNDNSSGTFLVYDAYLTPFLLNVFVQANQQYHFKAVLADAGDGIYDSGVIIKSGSFAGNIIAPAPSFNYTVNGNNVSFTNTTTNGMSYLWDFGDGTTSTDINPVHDYSSTGTYTLRLTASNHCYTEEIEQVIDLNATYSGICSKNKYNVSTLNENGIFSISGIPSGSIAEVYNYNGEILNLSSNISNNNLLIDLSQHSKGIYIVRVDGRTFKLVK